MRKRLAVALTALLVVAACDSDDDSTDSTTTDTGRATPTTLVGTATTAPAATETPEGSDVSVFPDGDINPALQPFIVQATDDLAARLGIAVDEITPVSAVLVTWSDGSYGCPAPGMQYAQVLEDGSVIELRAGDRVYRYHSGGNRAPFPCDVALEPVPTRV